MPDMLTTNSYDMTPERWQLVKAVFQSALERDPQERAMFLDQACADDPQLKNEVEDLISSYKQAGGRAGRRLA